MSLNGLDAAPVTAAHEAAQAEANGWFLLHYVSRDEVELLSQGTEGFAEAREAIAKYEEASPLFGLLVYKKKKALLKYVPEGTSRLLQARLAVHLQSVIENFPHEALLSLVTASDLTESALSATLTQLKSSNSVRSLGARKQRPLTEIAEDSDEASQRLSSVAGGKGPEPAADLGPESPPDPLLSPASQPFSPARIEDNTATSSRDLDYTPPTSPLVGGSRPAGDSSETERGVSIDASLERPGDLARAASYEPDIAWAFKPKIKLGPRPSLDHDTQARGSGTFARPIATLPAGIRVSTKNSREVERPRTQSSAKPFETEMPRYTTFLQMDRPKSRSGSIVSVPAYPTTSSSSSPPMPSVSLEKQRLMKALQQRKKQQAKKAEEAAARQAAEAAKSKEPAQVGDEEVPAAGSDGGRANSTTAQRVSEHALSATDENQMSIGQLRELPTAENATRQESASEGVSSPDSVNLARTEVNSALNSPVDSPLKEMASALEVSRQAESEENAVDKAGNLLSQHNGEANKPSHEAQPTKTDTLPDHVEAQESTFLDVDKSAQAEEIPQPAVAAKEKLSGPEHQRELEAGKEVVSTLEPAEDSSKTVATSDDAQVGLIRNQQSIAEGVYLAHSGSPSSTSEAGEEHPAVSPVTVSPTSPRGHFKDIQELHLPDEANAVELENTQPTQVSGSRVATATEVAAELVATEVSPMSSPLQEGHAAGENELGALARVDRKADPAEETGQLIKEAASDKQADLPTSNTPPLRGVVTDAAEAVDAPTAAIRDSQHRLTDSTSTVKAPISGLKINVVDAQTPLPEATKDIGQVDGSEQRSAEEKRFSADSKASTGDSKKRPPPLLGSSKHDSSDLASLDGESLYEELRSATVQQARPMLVSRSPAAPVFQETSGSNSRQGSDASHLSRVASGPTNASPLEGLRPTAPSATTPPLALKRVDSDASQPKNGKDTIEVAKLRSTKSPAELGSHTSGVNSSPGRKGSGVSSLISQRIKAFEGAGANSASVSSDRTAMIAPSIVNQRKASISTPPGSAGADSLNGSRNGNRPLPTPSPSPNGFVARTFGSVRVSSNHVHHHPNSLHRQSSRESASNVPSTSSSRMSSVNTSPNEVQKPTTSYFSVPAPPVPPKDRSATTSPKESSSQPSGSKTRRLSNTSSTTEKRDSRASFSSRRSTTSQKSSDTARPKSSAARSESSFSSDGAGDKGDKKQSRSSRLLRRMSSLAMSPRRNIAQALSPSLSDQAIEESNEPKKWNAIDVGEVNVQFPDTLLWKRRHLAIDAAGNLILRAASLDKSSKIAPKNYQIDMFRPPYIPDQDREEMPHSIILDFKDGSTLQCSCTDGQSQAHVLRVLRSAHAAFAF